MSKSFTSVGRLLNDWLFSRLPFTQLVAQTTCGGHRRVSVWDHMTSVWDVGRFSLAALCVAGVAVPVAFAAERPGRPSRASTLAAVASGAKSEASGSRSSGSGSSELTEVDFINAQIRQGWAANKMGPSPAATDGEWCRRLYLDVIGRLPTVEELNKYLSDRSSDRKRKLVDTLLGDEYVDEYARNWSTIWTNILIGRSGGTENRTLINRDGMMQSLRNAFQRDMTYDKLVYEIVSAKGEGRPGEKKFNGFVNFLVEKLADNGVEATAQTAQIFLGLQIRCTQCHNHPFNEWKQNQFWEMNAFFRQTKEKRLSDARNREEPVNTDLYNTDFDGEDHRPKEAVLFYELRNGLEKAAYPVFVDGTKLSTDSGLMQDVDRRTELAKLIVKSDYMPEAIVNRMWAHFLGYGFTKPIDDIGPHNAPTHPELLSELGKRFRKNSFDLKTLIRWITLSEPYGLSSQFSAKNKGDDPSLGERPMFTHFYLRQMQAEELYQSLLTATEAQKAAGSYAEQEKKKTQWMKQFTTAFGTDDGAETTTFNGTIPQVLMMMNGELTKSAIDKEKGGFLHNIATNPKLSNAGRIKYLFEAGLARTPTRDEIDRANELLQRRHNDAVGVLQDVWWAILNSNEFILNH